MLGTFFRSRGPVIGITMAIMFLQQYMIALLPILRYVLPWSLFVSLSNPSVGAIVARITDRSAYIFVHSNCSPGSGVRPFRPDSCMAFQPRGVLVQVKD